MAKTKKPAAKAKKSTKKPAAKAKKSTKKPAAKAKSKQPAAPKKPVAKATPKKPAAKPATPTAKPDASELAQQRAAALAPIYEALCGWFGPAVIDPIVAATNLETTSSYLLIIRLAKQLPALAAKLAPAASDNVLAYFLDPANDHPIEYHHDLDDDPGDWGSVKAIDPEDYGEHARPIFEADTYPRLITLRGKAVIVAEGMNGEGDVWEIDATTAVNHGSVPDLLADLRARIP